VKTQSGLPHQSRQRESEPRKLTASVPQKPSLRSRRHSVRNSWREAKKETSPVVFCCRIRLQAQPSPSPSQAPAIAIRPEYGRDHGTALVRHPAEL